MPDDTKECPFCSEMIRIRAKKCRYCGEFLPGFTRTAITGEHLKDEAKGDIVGSDIEASSDVAVGKGIQQAHTGDVGGSVLQAQGDITLGKDARDEQYAVAVNWDGQTRLRGFDLSNRRLDNLNLHEADLTGSNLGGADLRQTDLSYPGRS